jgi:hypothetical protein
LDAVLLRTPWDSPERLAEFLAWTEHVSRITCLLNPAGLITILPLAHAIKARVS